MSILQNLEGHPTTTPDDTSGKVRNLAVAGLLVAATWAGIAAWWMPRGPMTTSQAIWSIAISLIVGAVAGVLLRSRWAIVLTPAVFAVVFEVLRIGLDGPMVDGIHASMYGIIALVTGRGFHAVLALLPLAFGSAVGVGLVAGPTSRWSSLIMRTGVAIAALAVLVVSVGLLRPATTAPIVGPDGRQLTGSVAELTGVDIGTHQAKLMIRGHSTDNPVLLFLAGGPGGSEYGAMRRHLAELERHFTVVTWDQRGAGTAYSELDPTGTVSPEGAVSDTIAVTEYLRDRFGQQTIYLLGQSWGSTLGVLAVQQRPDLYAAFIGTGQMVSQSATDRIFYRDTLAWAQRTGNDELASELLASGPPPYEDMLRYEAALSHEQDVYPYDHSANSEGSGQMSENLLVEEYALIDQIHVLGAFMDTFAALYPQLQEIDFRRTATDFSVPVFFVQGAHEADGRALPFNEWYPMIDAPIKDRVVLETSGHRPLWEQPDAFVDYMVNTVLGRTSTMG